jgi:hypothetical protein
MDEVVAALKAILAALPATDGVAAFTRLYLAVTRDVRRTVRGGTFEDPAFLGRLDVEFASLYLDTVRRAATGEGAVPRAWAPLLDAAGRPGIVPLQFALAGMNAHVNRDLPLALVETCEARGVELRRRSPQHRDFRRIDALLAATEARAKADLVTGALAEADVALGRVDDVLAMWKVEPARAAAWSNAETVWALRGLPQLRASFLRTLDRTVGFAGRGLLRPLGPATRPSSRRRPRGSRP